MSTHAASTARTGKVAKTTKPLTKAEVLSRVRGLTGDTRQSTICALVGHTRLTTYCFGYLNCGRCGAQTGDTLMGSKVTGRVVEGHYQFKDNKDCDCAQVVAKLTWRDTLGMRETPNEWLQVGKRGG